MVVDLEHLFTITAEAAPAVNSTSDGDAAGSGLGDGAYPA